MGSSDGLLLDNVLAKAIREGGWRQQPVQPLALVYLGQLREDMQITTAARIAVAHERAFTGDGRERVGPGRQVPLPVDCFDLEVEPAALVALDPDHILVPKRQSRNKSDAVLLVSANVRVN